MSNFHVHTQITIVICVAVVAVVWLCCLHDKNIEHEREITHRISATNGMEIKRYYK